MILAKGSAEKKLRFPHVFTLLVVWEVGDTLERAASLAHG
jgi:hypothetical protein